MSLAQSLTLYFLLLALARVRFLRPLALCSLLSLCIRCSSNRWA
jgi:hypothetical protein